jgi:chemotaxis regulatin CheY-phosphate phosphatase CheZ
MSESVKNLNEMLVKLKEVDSVFKFGEKMIPVVEGFVSFIGDFLPFVEQISGSIEETRLKIPEASNQLNKVTNATELAMTEVLDKIDEISGQLVSINECMDELIERKVVTSELLESLRVHLNGSDEANVLIDKIAEVTVNTDQITMSLQVQDITAQQLAAVNHLIVSVQHKLTTLLNTVDSSISGSDHNLKLDKLPDVHFDANAEYNPKSNQQSDVDSIIKNEKASQEEIDKLFS